ncbi:MAG: HypC/HybG/HupF family hydrogenase formation chaperone [bacterium]
MCVAVPMKIKKIKNDRGIVEVGGTEREVSFKLLKDVRKGDYVIVHAGFAIQKLDEKEALETLELFKELEQYS